jgi:hypothetical protein
MSFSKYLLGKRVSEATTVHDYLQLCFNNSCSLSIFNKFRYLQFGFYPLKELTGEIITGVKENSSSIVIFFGEKSINIGLSDNDFVGPEAIVYRDDSGVIMVL